MTNGTDVKAVPVMDQNKAAEIKKMEAAAIEAHAADLAVIEAQKKMVEAAKSPEQKALDKAIADADTKRAKAMEMQMSARPDALMSVDSAKVLAPVPGDMSAGDHMAQKFGNDPANPKPGPHMSSAPESATVRITRKSPDHAELIETMVHPDMVGDYLRAGWNLGQ